MENETQELPRKKRIILCADGTWLASNRGNESIPSNVAKLARAIATTGLQSKKSDTKIETVLKQIVFYQSGIGSGDLPLERALSGGLGWGLEDDVCQIYDFISNNYDPGDELFFFGFSRGAFTVRSVAGLVSDVGVLSSDQMSNFPELWKAYRKNTDGEPFNKSDWFKEHGHKLKQDKVDIKVIGVWDTVGALGIPEWPLVRLGRAIGLPINKEYEFHNTNLSSNIEYAFQALALDETRFVFPPSVWHKAATGGPKEELCSAGFLAFMVDKLSGMLTFENDAIQHFIDEYKSIPGTTSDSWGCWPIAANGGPLLALGKRDRTPGEYKDNAGDTKGEAKKSFETFETFHPMVRKRKGQVNGWCPGSLNGFNKQQNHENRWCWKKDNGIAILEDDVMFKERKMVVAYAQGSDVKYDARGSLSRELCPKKIVKELESTSDTVRAVL
ncbi:T6SS phospholipase effector Tle1-like catalytic domain-containing protein [Aspergillus foveolatus]|uniref:T6SS phospholipase effector Tle1-like catalytic domain-containing protein n=1 Tax=Aspergillus foveolatus TaxID=210207 RepID=UPI003CCE504F